MTSEWKTSPLRDLVGFISKGIAPSYADEESETTVRVLNQKCNRNFRITYSESRLHDLARKKVPAERFVRIDDILINSTGAGTAGRIAQICNLPCDTIVDGHMIIIRANDKVSQKYLGYAMKAHQWEVLQLDEGSTGQTELNRERLLDEIMISYPTSFALQETIVKTLEGIDRKLLINEKVNDNLYEMVNAYYTSLFKENDCEMTTVGNYAERIYSGGTPMTSNAAYWNGTFGWFSSGETRNRFVISTEKTITQAGIDNSSTKLATKYDIVMASAGQGFTRGQTSMLLIDTYVNQSVIVIKSERNILPYLFWNLANRYDELRAISDSSSIRGSLKTKMIAAFEIPLAKAQSLQAFADFAWSVIHQIENNLLENERLTALRDSLLPKLMSGEIDVSDIQL